MSLIPLSVCIEGSDCVHLKLLYQRESEKKKSSQSQIGQTPTVTISGPKGSAGLHSSHHRGERVLLSRLDMCSGATKNKSLTVYMGHFPGSERISQWSYL